MNINIKEIINKDVKKDQIHIIIEHPNNTDIKDILNYLNNFKNEIIVRKDNQLLKISYNDIISFYSQGKENYCKTKDHEYVVKSKLYELETLNDDFMRISKRCIINIRHIQCFDIGKTGKIIIKLDNNDYEIVSRRKIKYVMDYLDKRRI